VSNLVRGRVAAVCALLAACGGGRSSEHSVDASTGDASKVPGGDGGVTIGPEGGSLATFGLEVDIPPGALSSPATLSVAQSTAAPPAGYELLTPVYRFRPDGITFAVPVTVHFELPNAGDAANVPAGASAYWSHPHATTYDPVTTTFAPSSATALVTHFSTAFVGVAEPAADGGADAAPDAPPGDASVGDGGVADANEETDAQEGGGSDAGGPDGGAGDGSSSDAAVGDAIANDALAGDASGDGAP
jgi:hypothetical protein